MFYSATGAGTLCIAKANNNAKQFYTCVSQLIFTVIKQGAHNDKLSNKLIFFNRHKIYFQDKAKNMQELLPLVLQ